MCSQWPVFWSVKSMWKVDVIRRYFHMQQVVTLILSIYLPPNETYRSWYMRYECRSTAPHRTPHLILDVTLIIIGIPTYTTTSCSLYCGLSVGKNHLILVLPFTNPYWTEWAISCAKTMWKRPSGQSVTRTLLIL